MNEDMRKAALILKLKSDNKTQHRKIGELIIKAMNLEKENAKLRARIEKLEKVREASYLPENVVNTDRDILDCIIVEIIHAVKNCEVGSDDKQD